MITLNDIVINERTFRDILESIYFGTNISIDIRGLNLFRKYINSWDILTPEQKLLTYNKFITLMNVFNEYQLMRFLLSNLDEDKWPILATMADESCKLYENYVNIHGKTVSILHLVSEDIRKELKL